MKVATRLCIGCNEEINEEKICDDRRTVMKRFTVMLAILFILFFGFLSAGNVSAAVMSDYCQVPPYVMTRVMPNIMIVYEKGKYSLNRAYSTTYTSSQSYYGFFDSSVGVNYSYNTSKDWFEKPTTACTPNGTNNCLPGNVLNWALMSAVDTDRKAIVGFGWPKAVTSEGAGDVFTYKGCFRFGGTASTCEICDDTSNPPSGCTTPRSHGQWKDKDADSATVSATLDTNGDGSITASDYTYSFCLEKATGSPPTTEITIKAKQGLDAPACTGGTTIVNNGKVIMRYTDEKRTGIFQKYADKDQNYVYDSDAPRFGLRRWKTSTAADERNRDILCDAVGGNCTSTSKATLFQDFLNVISKEPAVDKDDPDLGDMEKDIIKYFQGNDATYDDKDADYTQTPYKWSTDPAKSCRKSFTLYITTGVDLTESGTPLTMPAACTSLTYTDAFVKNACYGFNTDLYTTDGGTFSPQNKWQNLRNYVVHTKFYGTGGGNAAKLEYASKTVGGGEYLVVDDPNKFEQVLEEAILDILQRAASGTAASVLASGEGSGANLLRGVFYPRTPKIPFGIFDRRISWIGSLSNYWYYVDPFFTRSATLDDSGTSPSDKILNLSNDKVLKFRFDATNERTVVDRYSFDGSYIDTIPVENAINLWEAGVDLWKRDLSTSPRTIKTQVGGLILIDFSVANRSTLRPYLQASSDDEAEAIIRYIHGEDSPVVSGTAYPYRSRTVAVDLNRDGDVADTNEGEKVWKLGDILNSTSKIASWLPLNSYNTTYSDTTYQSFVDASAYANRGMVFAGGNDGMLHAFKLGRLELPNDSHADTCTFGTNDRACLSNPTGYLGGSSIPVGHEMWAFIPKNVLPYLRYILDTDYCHVYSVDLTPYIFDASINIDTAAAGQLAACSNTAYSDYWKCKKSVNSWKTILIGGMRTGGACRKTGVACNSGTDCVNTPKTDPSDSSKGLGYSSYFALDVTDQNNPQLLWEYSHPELGFATTGPAVVRIKSRTAGVTNSTPDADTNGRWFVVFGSGPTGPVSSGDMQFLGRSDQNMKLFVLDLKTGALATTNPIDTGITFAFAGSMLNAAHDSDTDYQDDAVYIPYVKKCTVASNICTDITTWTNGGIGRLLTKEDLDGNDVSSTGSTALNPNNWAWNKVIDNVGPVTSAVARLEKKSAGLMWLYFGTGRYYFVQGSAVDDADTRRMLFGIKDPCFSTSGFDTNCTTPRTFCATPCTNPSACTEPLPCGELTNVTNVANTPSNPEDASFKGWYINLEGSGSYTYCPDAARNFKAERVITDPLATSSGVVFFTTFKPYSDECDIGGKSFIWAVKYSTGGSAGTLLKGKAVIQVSTGSIEQLNLSTAFSEAGGRRTTALEGIPPTAQGLSIISPPPPVERILHIRER